MASQNLHNAGEFPLTVESLEQLQPGPSMLQLYLGSRYGTTTMELCRAENRNRLSVELASIERNLQRSSRFKFSMPLL